MGDDVVNIERETKEREGVDLETPERTQTNNPVPIFEDSSVFNYLNNLSPITLVKSVHITQTVNSLNFTSPPLVFASPHVSSVKESRFLRRHQLSDPSKQQSPDNVNKVGKHEEVIGIAHDSSVHHFASVSAHVESPYDSNLSNELSRTLNNKYAGPDTDINACSVTEIKYIPELTGLSSELDLCVHMDSGNFHAGSEFNIGEMSNIDQNKDVSVSNWDNLLSEEADLSIFESPNNLKSLEDPSHKSLDPGTSFCTSLSDSLQKSGATQAVGICQQSETDNISSWHSESSNMKDLAVNHKLPSNFKEVDTNESVDDELASYIHRGVRRRCLVSERVGSERKPLHDVSNINLSTPSHSYSNTSPTDKCLVPIKSGNDVSSCTLPGIGLHLNALASTLGNNKLLKHEVLNIDKKQLKVFPSTICPNSSIRQKRPKNSLIANLPARNMLPGEDDIFLNEDASQASEYVVNEEFNHTSPRKKTHKLESSDEREPCKHCNCKKSKCLKLYCECFAAGVYCVEPCACKECFNKPSHEDTVLAARKQIESRNPVAFALKVIRSSESVIKMGEESSKTPASARHKRGCNCRKSGCTKKYCECYQGGVGCSINCRCEGCKNAFGRKDGSTSIEIEVEPEEEKKDNTCRSLIDRSLQVTLKDDAEQNTNSALSKTPLRFGRQLIKPSYSSTSKRPAHSSLPALRSFKKLNPPQAKSEKHTQTGQENKMPKILQSPNSCINIKSVSPNSMRVSPPHSNISLTSGLRGSRKLILQSIPSFPSLTSKDRASDFSS